MRTTPTPDVVGMVDRGQERLRRRNSTRIGLAAAAVLLAAGGAYGVTQIGGGDSDARVSTAPIGSAKVANPPSWQSLSFGFVAAGTYRTHVGVAADGKRLEADLTIDGSNWEGSNYPVVYDGENHFAGIGVYQAESVGGGCQMDAGFKPAAAEPQQLVEQFTRMPRSEVVQQPTPTNAFGYGATHLQLKIDAGCEPATAGAAYLVADASAGARGISYFDSNSDGVSRIVILDLWVVDVNGTTVVVDTFHTDDAPKTLVDQATAARESITFLEAD